MRILDRERVVTDLDRLGMQTADRELLEHSVGQLHGAVLVTGPTGAGKTTTLYAALTAINTPDRTLITIEDPVEYELAGVKQVQVNPAAGVTFARGLRSMIRNDPDVLMVGEIRDGETAQIAIESALTGHLVLSTLHTKDAPMAAARLVDMGIEPFLVATGVECVIAQRLARRLCEECRRPVSVTAEVLRQSGFAQADEAIDAYEPGGCVRCGGMGYSGRVGLYEIMVLTDEIRAPDPSKGLCRRDQRRRDGRRNAATSRRRPREGPQRDNLGPGGAAGAGRLGQAASEHAASGSAGSRTGSCSASSPSAALASGCTTVSATAIAATTSAAAIQNAR